MRLRILGAALAMLSAGLIVAGCGSSTDSGSASSGSSGSTSSSSSSSGDSATNRPFKVLFDADTTGPLKAYGQQDLNGLKSVIDYLNANGGMLGQRIELDTVSSNGDTATAVSNLLRYLTSNSAPDFVFSGTAGNEVSALIPILARRGLLSASVNDGANQCARDSQTACPTFFTVAAPSNVPQEAVARFFKDRGARTVGILEANEAFTQTETPAIQAALRREGISTVEAKFPSTATDLTSQVQQLQSDGADAIYAEVLGAPAGYAAAARAKLGWDAPLVFDVAASSVDLTRLADPSQLRNAYEVVFRTNDPSQRLAGLPLLVRGAERYGGVGGGVPVDVAAFPWDDMLTVAAGVRAARSFDPKAIMAALERTAVTDPNLLLSSTVQLTPDIHENTAGTPADYPVIAVGPIRDGQVQAP
ncbi:MAG TPA: ABC transporter substrate-binding protein [Conexibacter sp.]